MSIAAMKQALEALEKSVATCFHEYAHEQVMSFPEHFINQTITALRAAIEQGEKQEPLGYWNAVQGWVELPDEPQPVAWVYPEALEAFRQGKPWTAYGSWDNGGGRIPLYTAPRQWVGLTEEEIEQGKAESWVAEQAFESAVWWADAKLKEKNDVLRSV